MLLRLLNNLNKVITQHTLNNLIATLYADKLTPIYSGPQVSQQFILKLRHIKSRITANINFIARIKIFVVAQLISCLGHLKTHGK